MCLLVIGQRPSKGQRGLKFSEKMMNRKLLQFLVAQCQESFCILRFYMLERPHDAYHQLSSQKGGISLIPRITGLTTSLILTG